jgi:uncharacterized phage-associated protein
MANVHDVAAYILSKCGRMSAMKLQKLVYYSQAWALVWDDRPIFNEEIQAWANGPVAPDLYDKHRGQYSVSEWQFGDGRNLSEDHAETIGIVLDFYAKHDAQQLSDLTHSEPPWRIARGGLPEGAPCNNPITHESMAEYYGSLQ